MNAVHSVHSSLTWCSCLWAIVFIFCQLLILSEFYSLRSIFIVFYAPWPVTLWEVSDCLHGIHPKTRVCGEPEKPLHMHIQAVFLLYQCKPSNVFRNEIRGVTLVFNAKCTVNTSWWMKLHNMNFGQNPKSKKPEDGWEKMKFLKSYISTAYTTWWFRGKEFITNDFWTNFSIQSFETLHHLLRLTQFRHKFQINLPFWNCSIYVEALRLYVFKSKWRCEKSDTASLWK